MVFRVLYNGGIHRRGKFILASVIRSAISAVAPGDNATTELRNLPNICQKHSLCDQIASMGTSHRNIRSRAVMMGRRFSLYISLVRLVALKLTPVVCGVVVLTRIHVAWRSTRCRHSFSGPAPLQAVDQRPTAFPFVPSLSPLLLSHVRSLTKKAQFLRFSTYRNVLYVNIPSCSNMS